MFAPYDFSMDYIIGAGAILETGESGSITPATLHAQVDPALAEQVKAAAVDFEGTSAQNLKRLLVVAQGWDGARFSSRVTQKLRATATCMLADVFATLAAEMQVKEVHLFAHWLPDEATYGQLAAAGIALVVHPLESIRAAALVAGQRCRRYAA